MCRACSNDSDPESRAARHPDSIGNGGKLLGRRPGYVTKGRIFATRLVESEDYRKWIHDRIFNRDLDPSIERMLWAYAYGKPKETVEITTRNAELSEAPMDMLHERAKSVATLLSQLNTVTTKEDAERLIAALDAEESSPHPLH